MKKITIIEDDSSIRDVLNMIFEADNYDVTLLEDGKEVLNHTLAPPDLFIIDRFLSEQDGLELCRHIKASADYSPVPVLIISGAADIEPMARTAGAEAVLAKPFRIKTIREMVARAMIGKYREFKD